MGLNIRTMQLSKRVAGVLHQKTVYWVEDLVFSMTSLDNYICDGSWVFVTHMMHMSVTSWELCIVSTLTC